MLENDFMLGDKFSDCS